MSNLNSIIKLVVFCLVFCIRQRGNIRRGKGDNQTEKKPPISFQDDNHAFDPSFSNSLTCTVWGWWCRTWRRNPAGEPTAGGHIETHWDGSTGSSPAAWHSSVSVIAHTHTLGHVHYIILVFPSCGSHTSSPGMCWGFCPPDISPPSSSPRWHLSWICCSYVSWQRTLDMRVWRVHSFHISVVILVPRVRTCDLLHLHVDMCLSVHGWTWTCVSLHMCWCIYFWPSVVFLFFCGGTENLPVAVSLSFSAWCEVDLLIILLWANHL